MSGPAADWPADRWATIDGRRLRYWSGGTGRPTVILEAGLGGGVQDWIRVFPELAARTRVIAYDRAGLGASDRRPDPPLASRAVGDLSAVLEQAGAEPPYVVVAHSWGGVLARYFALHHPDLVRGLVLVDVTHEDTVGTFAAKSNRATYAVMEKLAPSGVLGRVLKLTGSLDHYPERERDYVLRALRGTTMVSAARAEADAITSSLGELRIAVEQLGPLTIPVVVLSAGGKRARRGPVARVYRRLHAAHALLATPEYGGRHEVVAGCSHYLQLDRPDALIRAVDACVTAVTAPAAERARAREATA